MSTEEKDRNCYLRLTSKGYVFFDPERPDEVPTHRIKLEFAMEGCDCPLQPYQTMYVNQPDGTRLKLISDKDKFLEKIWVDGDPDKTTLTEVGIDQDNGIWFFFQGHPIDN